MCVCVCVSVYFFGAWLPLHYYVLIVLWGTGVEFAAGSIHKKCKALTLIVTYFNALAILLAFTSIVAFLWREWQVACRINVMLQCWLCSLATQLKLLINIMKLEFYFRT